ncbi:MAG: GntR family transcriptional regulator [Chelatococcus sp.]|uniref:GntR family transcriptional regulator n=1 Tax=Chelatococcus sp. TaxID=1953771 RepID=UPI0025C575A9|nr:GntR family transcriptional regulator [Chelatococcus sp.]MBX3540803.1 GntR family transcriptional regulator [Chelatococcus sp.]
MVISEQQSSRQRAYEAFTRHLLAHAVRPGQFVSQRELVELTGLPVGVVRELVSRLEAEGLVMTVPHRGMQIAYVGIDLIRDAFQYRAMIEREAVASFAIAASAEEIADWRRIHEAVLATCERGLGDKDPAVFLAEAQAMDFNFHTTIVDALGNAIISDAYRVNSLKLSLVRQERGRLTMALLPLAMKDHLSIITALEKSDAVGAVEAMARHIMRGRNRSLGIDSESEPR